MLRGNLSTRPFYHERAVHAALIVVAAVAMALMVYNAQRLVTLSRQYTELTREAEQDEADARDLEGRATGVQRSLNPDDLLLVTSATQEANTLIDQRTFSWTDLFNRIETTLPPDVMVTSLRPLVKDGTVTVSIVVIGRRIEDIDAFIEELERTGTFVNLLSRQEEITEDNMYRASLDGQYVPSQARGDATPPTEG